MGSGSTGSIGDTPNSMGANLTSLDFGPGFNISAASNCGGGSALHHCVLADDASLKCWGANDYGQLGLGDEANRGDDPGEMGVSLSFVQFAFTTAQPTPEPTAPSAEPTTEPTDTPSSAQPSLNPLLLPTTLPSTTMVQSVVTTTDDGNGANKNFTITIVVGSANDTLTNIIKLVAEALDLSEGDVVSSKGEDGTLFITVRVPADSDLDSEAIERLIEEKLAEEYGDDGIEVDVVQNGRPEGSEESADTNLWIYAVLCAVIFVLCVVALTLCMRRRKRRVNVKARGVHMQVSAMAVIEQHPNAERVSGAIELERQDGSEDSMYVEHVPTTGGDVGVTVEGGAEV